MSEKWNQPAFAVLKHWLRELQQPASIKKANEWERKFIADMDWRLFRNMPLSRNQVEKLEQIYVEYTS